jgi:dienelactone hydrolase
MSVSQASPVSAASLINHAKLSLPRGEGPHPLVMLLHGCGGVQPYLADYAAAAVEAGVAALIVDSFAPRGISRLNAHATVCTGLRLRGVERAKDLFALLAWARTQAHIDPERIALAGWSHGGWTAMEAFARPPAALTHHLDQVRAVIAVYPYAGPLALTARRGWGGRRPQVFGVLAEADHVVGVKAPEQAFRRLSADGLNVELLRLSGATHAFDDAHASDPRTRHDPAHTAACRAFFVKALNQSLG